ncbi:MAG: hypothetical protein GIX03_08310 [Candidatus Eremiobacteraeota bacterium]|nr:hypothetical protein [Candidatus Eremiobacteraeota bacterium]MBC5802989.1 hypothetical protein [Candidatus Eremiobacteraeota bacterium]MBC5823163.1 hypothetical protein [Candidatus Eremiobacteraeota bacterium]
MRNALPVVESFTRVPAPAPAPIGIAFDGSLLWIGSVETDRLYAVDPRTRSVMEEWPVPGTPYGLVAHDGDVRVVVGDAESDDRSIARFVRGKGFDAQTIPCPDATGSWLASDGETLYLSQRFEHRILALDRTGAVQRTIPVRREITGMTIVDDDFFLLTTESKEVDDYRIVRLDAHGVHASETESAALPLSGRGLAFDGTRFWTNLREQNTMVSFVLP